MAKATLTLEVEYDEKKTDPESLASALDTLLETALSTTGNLDEYGDPQFGEFYVACTPESRPSRTRK
jgi:hypothetical protein